MLFRLAIQLSVSSKHGAEVTYGLVVSLRHQRTPYLVHESLSSVAEKLKPYGFIRIHRSVIVNISAVEEIQPLPTGEYGLRVKGGKEYLVTRNYKRNLRDLAQLWAEPSRAFGPCTPIHRDLRRAQFVLRRSDTRG